MGEQRSAFTSNSQLEAATVLADTKKHFLPFSQSMSQSGGGGKVVTHSGNLFLSRPSSKIETDLPAQQSKCTRYEHCKNDKYRPPLRRDENHVLEDVT